MQNDCFHCIISKGLKFIYHLYKTLETHKYTMEPSMKTMGFNLSKATAIRGWLNHHHFGMVLG
jgi:hypothetical protein